MNPFPNAAPLGGTPAPWNMPTAFVQDLTSGLRVVAVRVGALPIVQARWVFGAGRSLEPPNRIGAGALLQRVMRHGTQQLRAREFAATLDRMGARMGGGVSIDASAVSIAGLAQHQWRIIDLVTDVALRPSLSDLALAGEKVRCRALHHHACTRPDSIVEMMLDRRIYGDHPYGRPATTNAGLSATSRADLVAMHAAIAHPSRGMLLVVGDIDPQDTVRRLSVRFADLIGAKRVDGNAPPPLAPAPRRMLWVEHPTAEQTTIGMGGGAVRRSHPGHAALRIANQAVGGGPSSRLFRSLRGDLALTYAVQSSLDCGVHAGDVTASMAVEPRSAGDGLAAMMACLQQVVDCPLNDDELQHAKRVVMGSFPQRASGLTGVASLVTAGWLHALPDDEWSAFVPRMEAVAAHEVHAACRRWFDPQRFTVVACGPPASEAVLRGAARRHGIDVDAMTVDELAGFVG